MVRPTQTEEDHILTYKAMRVVGEKKALLVPQSALIRLLMSVEELSLIHI